MCAKSIRRSSKPLKTKPNKRSRSLLWTIPPHGARRLRQAIQFMFISESGESRIRSLRRFKRQSNESSTIMSGHHAWWSIRYGRIGSAPKSYEIGNSLVERYYNGDSLETLKSLESRVWSLWKCNRLPSGSIRSDSFQTPWRPYLLGNAKLENSQIASLLF